MSIDMYLEAARTQAESLGRAVEQCLGQNLKLISVLSAFHNENELTGKAYDSAKNHVVGTVIPIVQGVILYQEAIALACQNFVSNYTAEVDGKSWRQSELEEKIRFAEQSWSANRNSMQIIKVCLLWILVLPSLLQKVLGKSSKKFWIICLLLMRVRQLSSRKLKRI